MNSPPNTVPLPSFETAAREPSLVPSPENKPPSLREPTANEKEGQRNENAGKENEKHLPSKLPGLHFKIKEEVLFKKK